jgi:hypothetical protein
MPRSRREIERDNRAIERCKTVIQNAIKDYKGQWVAAPIAQRIQGNVRWCEKIEADKPLLRYLWGEGIKIEIRAALAEWGLIEKPGEQPPQLSLFPECERKIVAQIAMARIWVPAKNGHVQYHDLSPELLREAAAYYRSLSRGIARKAVLIEQLAKLREGDPEAKAAA